MAAPGAPAASRGPNASSPLDAICALLQHHKNEDYAWMPECLNDYMRSALQQAVAPAAEGPGAAGTGEQHASEDRSEGGEAGASATGSAASGAAGPSTAAGEQPSGDAVIALGTSEHVKGGGARVARWVAHVGLVLAPLHARPPAPGGSSASAPAAAGTPQAAAGMAGACAVLSLQDAAPAPMGPALLAAFNKGPWARYGLKLRRLLPCDATLPGLAKLAPLPGVPPVPLALVVCSNTLFYKPPDIDSVAPSRRAPPRAPELSKRAEGALWAGALVGALDDLRAQLPSGYLLSRAQARVAGSLPSIAAAMAAIARRAHNPQLQGYACTLLGCEPAGLEARVLQRMTAAADAALCPAPPAPSTAAGAQGTHATRWRGVGTRGAGSAAEGGAASQPPALGDEDAADGGTQPEADPAWPSSGAGGGDHWVHQDERQHLDQLPLASNSGCSPGPHTKRPRRGAPAGGGRQGHGDWAAAFGDGVKASETEGEPGEARQEGVTGTQLQSERGARLRPADDDAGSQLDGTQPPGSEGSGGWGQEHAGDCEDIDAIQLF